MRIFPILFNTQMVQAIFEGRKSVTRRLVKHDVESMLNSPFRKSHLDVADKQIIEKLCRPPYQAGDILYVRETWSEWTDGYIYKAWNSPFPQPGKASIMKWHPSLHMPREAARIFLMVKDIRVERLQDITPEQVLQEGTKEQFPPLAIDEFRDIWDSTVKKSDLVLYGWDANPWVWVIEFERCEKPKGFESENG